VIWAVRRSTPGRPRKSEDITTEKIDFVVTQICDICRPSSRAIRPFLLRRVLGARAPVLGARTPDCPSRRKMAPERGLLASGRAQPVHNERPKPGRGVKQNASKGPVCPRQGCRMPHNLLKERCEILRFKSIWGKRFLKRT
jgi:hypothetical protein